MKNKIFGCLLILLLVGLLALPGEVHAQAAAAPLEEDTTPQSTVVFSGNNNNNEGYLPGETVHVDVRGPDGTILTCDALVTASGSWSCSVNLWQNSKLIGTFYYQVVGRQSGVTFTGSFSNDSAIQTVRLFSQGQEVLNDTNIAVGSSVDAIVVINTTNHNIIWGSTQYQIQRESCGPDAVCTWLPVYTSSCINLPEPDITDKVTDQEVTFPNVFDQTTANVSYVILFTTFSDGSCQTSNGSQWYYSPQFTLTPQETQTTLSCDKVEEDSNTFYSCEVNVRFVQQSEGNPTGRVEFSISPEGTGVLSPASCTLTQDASEAATCSTTYYSNQDGTYLLTAEFQSDDASAMNSQSSQLPLTFKTVTPVVVVSANAVEKTYGQNDPPLTFSYEPSGQFIAFSGALTRQSGEDTGQYEITQGSLAAAGYTIQYSPAFLTIRKAKAVIKVEPFKGAYDGEDHGLSGSAVGIKGEDLNSLLVYGSSFKDVPGGNTFWIFKGNENYLPDTQQMIPVQISPLSITVTADALSKVYGEEDPEFTYTVTGGSLLTNDTLAGSITRQADEAAGLHMLEQGTLSAGPNYDLVFVSSWFRIDPRSITVAADPQIKETGSSDPLLTFLITDGSLMTGDMFGGSIIRGSGETPGIYPIGQGTLYLSNNYQLTFKPSTFSVFQPLENLDEDYDGVSNPDDNCVFMANNDQQDSDSDGFGDACDTTSSDRMANMVVPVTGNSVSSLLSCSGDTTLKVEGDSFTVLPPSLCEFSGIFSSEAEASLPKAIPEDGQFLSAVNLALVKDQGTQDIVDVSEGITYSVKLPTEILATVKILFWDTTKNQGLGDWVELPTCPVDAPVSISPANTEEARLLMSCTQLADKKRLEFSTNFTGLFLLVGK